MRSAVDVAPPGPPSPAPQPYEVTLPDGRHVLMVEKNEIARPVGRPRWPEGIEPREGPTVGDVLGRPAPPVKP